MSTRKQVWIGVAVAAVLVGLLAQHNNKLKAADPRQTTGQQGIVLLAADWCGYCDAMRQDLRAASVPFTEIDVDTDAGDLAWRSVGGRGVPVIIVGQKLVFGYQPERVFALAKAAGHSVAGGQ